MIDPVAGKRRRRPSSADLERAGREVVRDYLAGQWAHLDGAEWAATRTFLLNELLERCPGHSTRDYRVALDVSLVRRRSMLKLRLQRRQPPRLQPCESKSATLVSSPLE